MPCEHCPHCKEEARKAAAEAKKNTTTLQPALLPAQEQIPQLNEDQSQIALEITNTWRHKPFHVIDGIAGVGKTYLLVALAKLFRNASLHVEHVSYSALGSPSGTTIHTLIRSPYEVLQKIDVILIDNVNRILKDTMVELSDKLRSVMHNQSPFGGKCVVLAVDFGLCLPFCEDLNRRTSQSSRLFVLDHTDHVNRHFLSTPDNPWSQWVDKVRTSVREVLPDPEGLLTTNLLAADLDSLVNFVYGKLYDTEPSCIGTILGPRKCHVDEINREVMKRLKGPEDEFEAQFDGNIIRSDLDLHTITLKPNTIISLELAHKGLPIGTRLLFIESDRNRFLICRVIDGPHAGDEIEVERVARNIAASPHESHQWVKQFPVTVAFGMSIHSAQGRRFGKVGVYKLSECYEHGMIYSALSRTDSSYRLRVFSEDKLAHVPASDPPIFLSGVNLSENASLESLDYRKLTSTWQVDIIVCTSKVKKKRKKRKGKAVFVSMQRGETI
uniref:ATP-dependent DNA helicase n=1 Tax=Caenorhabditis japonica TaxID=281687 RepID=A0A8R1HVS5_CAEJA